MKLDEQQALLASMYPDSRDLRKYIVPDPYLRCSHSFTPFYGTKSPERVVMRHDESVGFKHAQCAICKTVFYQPK